MDIVENILSKKFTKDISDIIIRILWKDRFNIVINQVKKTKHIYMGWNTEYTGYRNPRHTIYLNNICLDYYEAPFDGTCGFSEVTQEIKEIDYIKRLVIRKTKKLW